MNIKITDSWLREYVETDATPSDLQSYLSLCGPSIEKVTRVQSDFVYDIEVTTNRVDMASVLGIAQEAVAILPRFGKKAKLIQNPLSQTFQVIESLPKGNMLPVTFVIAQDGLTKRFTGIVMDHIRVEPSPKFIQERLTACDIRPINNVVDISNYVMLALGQPNHTFDYDTIGKSTLTLRTSRAGEEVVTLDNKKVLLGEGDMVIEDGDHRLIDLAGIMGGANTAITQQTKRVLILMETYDKVRVRKTSMTTAQRSVAATYFEKGLDPQRIESALVAITRLLSQHAGGVVASEVKDIYPNHIATHVIDIDSTTITEKIGVHIPHKEIVDMITSLGFTVEHNDTTMHITVPSYRQSDVTGKQDIIEEVARIYGYFNIPNVIQTTTYVKQPREIELQFALQQKIKYYLKHLGAHESMNYSMVSKDILQKLDIDIKNTLRLSNTISEEIEYLRPTLIPSLIMNMRQNQGKVSSVTFFEIAKTYIPKKNTLPHEELKIGIITNRSYADLKGMIEGIASELHMGNLTSKITSTHKLYSPHIQADLYCSTMKIGSIGQLRPTYRDRMTLSQDCIIAELDFAPFIKLYHVVAAYTAPQTFATLKQDLTITRRQNLSYAQIVQCAYAASVYLRNIEVVNTYDQSITLRFYFNATEHNMTEDEATHEVKKIASALEKI